MKNKAAQLINDASLRQTKPRLAILEVLLDTDTPLTQDQIAEKIGPDAPNKTTIYRTLTHLLDKGLVHEAFTDHRSRHYELAHHCGKQSCHPHFICSRCEQTQCLTRTRVQPINLPDGYILQRQQIRIEGICPKCAG